MGASGKPSMMKASGMFTAKPPPGGVGGRFGFRNRQGGRGVVGGIHLAQSLKDKQREESKAKAYKQRRIEHWFQNHHVITVST